MAFYPNQNIFQPSSGSETYTISTTQNNTQYQKAMSECIDLIRTKVPGANLIILKRDSGLRGYYIGGAVISENIFYIGDTAEYPGNMEHYVYFGNGSNTGTIQIRYYTVYYRTGARLDDNPMQTDTYQVEQIGEIGNCFWTNPGGNDLGNVVYVSGGYNQLVINDGPPVLYQWSSVPAISGKNGILSLTKILNINDGEPVQDITKKGNLDFSKKTKVNTLVNNNYEPTYKEDATKATVEYEIPEAEYQYTKLVYKKKKIPKSASDGDAIDIGADDTEVVVTGLEENSTYYFVVFTNRTKSNAYKFKTGKNDAPEGIIFEIIQIAKPGVEDKIIEEIEINKIS